MSLLLLSCYELGHQPLSLAWPLALLRQAGFAVAAHDLAVEAFDEAWAADAELVVIFTPMHTALVLGVQAAQRVRALKPKAHICLAGLYAWLNADYVLETVADSVVGGEVEPVLVALAQALGQGADWRAVPGVVSAVRRNAPHLERIVWPVPERAPLPALTHYAQYAHNGHRQLAGYVEASRGCLHTCQHCPITPVYQGRFFVVPVPTVLADVRQQVTQGAGHITFGDPDFLNGPKHALKILRALHAEFPALTFNFTAKVEHILKHRALFPEVAALGCTFIVSAIESLSDEVLARLQKGHTAKDIDAALSILDAAGIALQPTLVAFTPWTTLEDYLAQLVWIEAHGLERHIPPIQLTIRLLLPPHSPLLPNGQGSKDAGVQGRDTTTSWLRDFDPTAFTWRWQHPDPRMELLCEQVTARVAQAEAEGEDPHATYAALRAIAYSVAGWRVPVAAAMPLRPAPPHLTEHWFC